MESYIEGEFLEDEEKTIKTTTESTQTTIIATKEKSFQKYELAEIDKPSSVTEKSQLDTSTMVEIKEIFVDRIIEKIILEPKPETASCYTQTYFS